MCLLHFPEWLLMFSVPQLVQADKAAHDYDLQPTVQAF